MSVRINVWDQNVQCKYALECIFNMLVNFPVIKFTIDAIPKAFLKCDKCKRKILYAKITFLILHNIFHEICCAGKSLHIQRLQEQLPPDFRRVTIRFLNKQVDENEIMNRLISLDKSFKNSSPVFLHFDVTPSVSHTLAYAVIC